MNELYVENILNYVISLLFIYIFNYDFFAMKTQNYVEIFNTYFI